MANKNGKQVMADMLKKSMASLKEAAEDTTREEDVSSETIAEQVNEIIENVDNNQKDKSIEQNNNKTIDKPQENPKSEASQEKQQETNTPALINNVVVTYSNPMKELLEQYNAILLKIEKEQKENLSGFRKKQPQSEIYANVTIQVRRDMYTAINDYMVEMQLGKTKVLNEIFSLGINEFIKKFDINEQT